MEDLFSSTPPRTPTRPLSNIEPSLIRKLSTQSEYIPALPEPAILKSPRPELVSVDNIVVSVEDDESPEHADIEHVESDEGDRLRILQLDARETNDIVFLVVFVVSAAFFVGGGIYLTVTASWGHLIDALPEPFPSVLSLQSTPCCKVLLSHLNVCCLARFMHTIVMSLFLPAAYLCSLIVFVLLAALPLVTIVLAGVLPCVVVGTIGVWFMSYGIATHLLCVAGSHLVILRSGDLHAV